MELLNISKGDFSLLLPSQSNIYAFKQILKVAKISHISDYWRLRLVPPKDLFQNRYCLSFSQCPSQCLPFF